MTKKLLQGNHAVVEGAIKAGCKFFSAYPITPASEIMHYMSTKDVGFVHAEDEIAGINMAIGASMAGVKALTSTSGPGFSLKQEGIGFAHMTKTPLVIVDVQRVGPSTGMPTLPNQGDIMQSRFGSHGDYFPIVFYPNSVEESYKYTIEAFNAAEESLSPVVLLTDGFIGLMYETVDFENMDVKVLPRTKTALGDGAGHFAGILNENGIPRTKDTVYFKKWIKDYKERINNVAKKYNFYEYIENKDSDTLLIAFGITSRVITPLKDKYSIFRPIRIWPVLDELKDIAKKYKRIVVIEMNDGQYLREVEGLLKRDVAFISCNGGALSLEEIKNEL
ncbi:2-oxoacid:acceptor oxidoreductase subunit alpha [Candidatus Woesearchaeota archaeon]|nr:2-oxoacid:acceptor oxidoreductase subunit alpha [Candidatus Woesearchaeota archaeon]MBW3022360.1 2-oxoacid:acceptor oxidoreductase subunit alpha [Candidatus Woesearchaeota archaeon]